MQLAMIADNPDLFIVFNASYPPATTHAIIEVIIQRNIIGRLWVEHYAGSLLCMDKEHIYRYEDSHYCLCVSYYNDKRTRHVKNRSLLQNVITAQEICTIIGTHLPLDLINSQGDRPAMMCKGNVWIWQDAVRALRDDLRGPQLLEASQTFCWAPQELCTFVTLNTSSVVSPIGYNSQHLADTANDAPFRPKHPMFGRFMTRYYCCVLARVPGVQLSDAALTPEEWSEWTADQERSYLKPETPISVPEEKLPFRLAPVKQPYKINQYLVYLINWKLAPEYRVGGSLYVSSQLEPQRSPFKSLCALGEIWNFKGTGSLTSPFIGLQPALKFLNKDCKVCFLPGTYPAMKLSDITGSYYFPVTLFAERPGTVFFKSRGMHRNAVVHLENCRFIHLHGLSFEEAMYGVDACSSYAISFSKCHFKRVHQAVYLCADDVENNCFQEHSNTVSENHLGPINLHIINFARLSQASYLISVIVVVGSVVLLSLRVQLYTERHLGALLMLSVWCMIQDMLCNQVGFTLLYLAGKRLFVRTTAATAKEIRTAEIVTQAVKRFKGSISSNPERSGIRISRVFNEAIAASTFDGKLVCGDNEERKQVSRVKPPDEDESLSSSEFYPPADNRISLFGGDDEPVRPTSPQVDDFISIVPTPAKEDVIVIEDADDDE